MTPSEWLPADTHIPTAPVPSGPRGRHAGDPWRWWRPRLVARHLRVGAVPCYRDLTLWLTAALLTLIALVAAAGCAPSGSGWHDDDDDRDRHRYPTVTHSPGWRPPSSKPSSKPSKPSAKTTKAKPNRYPRRPPVPPLRPVRPVSPVTVRVVRVVDGDTIRIGLPGGGSRSVRLIGIDTPERGCPGYHAATTHLKWLIGTPRVVVLVAAPGRDRDRYQRLLRYVHAGTVRGVDVGYAQLRAGHATARYDSREPGYDWHPRETSYRSVNWRAPWGCTRR